MSSTTDARSASPAEENGTATPGDRSFFGHPRGLATLFGTEMWERFSYYGMRAILVLYLVMFYTDNGMSEGSAETQAKSVFAVYVALVYMMPLVGGWVADRLWGAARTVFIGGIVITAGHFVLALPWEGSFYAGLGLLAIGTGFLKSNISAMVGHLYSADDARRDSGFALFYMGINFGSLVGQLVVGYVGETKGQYHLGFAMAGFVMVLGLVQYRFGGKYLGKASLTPVNPVEAAERRKAFGRVGAGLAVIVLLLVLDVALGTFHVDHIVNTITFVGVALPVAYFTMMLRSKKTTAAERPKVRAFIWFFIGASMFWLIFDQAASTLTLFAKEKADRHLFGWEIPSSWLQVANPAFIVVLAPVVAAFWLKLGKRQPSTVHKFGYSLLLVGCSFLVLAVAGQNASSTNKIVFWWLILVYLIQTVAELHLSPVGLSVTTKLAPAAFSSQMMGVWFLATATGNAVGAQVVKLEEHWGTLGYYGVQGAAAALGGVAFFLGASKIKALMGDVK